MAFQSARYDFNPFRIDTLQVLPENLPAVLLYDIVDVLKGTADLGAAIDMDKIYPGIELPGKFNRVLQRVARVFIAADWN
jgi:hypothetical protein